MSELPTRDILIFTGQGSIQHLSEPGTNDDLREQLGEAEASAFADFLLNCQNAFRKEIEIISAEEISVLGCDANSIRTIVDQPEFILKPPKTVQSQPIFEALSLYTRQILELMTYQTQNPKIHVVETSGICTGVIPAILAASYTSYSSLGFINAAVEGFRLAFWIGLRAALFTKQSSKQEADGSPCVLGVFGVREEALSDRLASYQEKNEGVTGNVKVSAIFSNANISLSGHGSDLHDAKSSLSADGIECRWAHVHALFHRGKEMQGVFEQTLRDIETRAIKFPDWKALHSPIRAVTDGEHWMPGSSSRQCLVDVALRSIFNDQVDWRSTSQQMIDKLLTRFEYGSDTKYRILGFGPGSRSLLQFAKDLSTSAPLEVIDNLSDSLKTTSGEDIAIVGLSVNYPGGKGLKQFWDILAEGTNVVSEIPTSRFDVSELHASDEQLSSIKYGNFLTDPFDFDPAFFNISPREAKSMDPQQRLLLRGALEALDDAGYAPNATETFQTNRMGVYVGVATCDYVDNLRNDIDVYYSPGTLRAFISGRISYAFKFGGPSMVFDTACSSSMVAVHHACRALKSGECTAALAGGVNTISSPDMYCGLSRAHFLSPTGQCKPFDASADGYCRSEGCGMIVLKKLSRAIEEGDHVYGVIRGTAINQCGTAKSITHPDADTQANLVKSVLESSRTRADSIQVIEAHGTGTQAGDHTEVTSISSVFGRRPPENPLYVSSLKGNMGHAEAASGVASLAKLLMMMEKRKIPPQASFKTLNPRLKAVETNGMVIPTYLKAWSRRATKLPRRALLNNFGASGSNSALVLEEFVPRPLKSRNGNARLQPSKRSHHLLNLSAKTERALDALRISYATFLDKNPATRLEDICYTANARRPEYSPHRSSIIASSAHDLLEQLQKPLQDTYQATSKVKKIFIFSGQGNIYNGMGADMISTVPLFRDTVDKCDAILSEHGFPPVKPFLQDTRPESTSQGRNDEIIIAQCACFVLEYALAVVWMDWGIIPDIVMGHSIGEYAAFAFTGSISLEDALLLLAQRARLMANKCVAQSTGMLACRLSPEEAQKILAEKSIEFEDVTIACFNSPKDVVLAGPPVSLAKLVQHCKAKGLRHKRLDVLYGFHSLAMDPILEELADLSRSLTFKPPEIPMGSSLYGRLLGGDEVVDAEYFARHSREPVNFCGMAEEAVKSLSDFNIQCLEIGPSPSTEPMFKQIMVNQPYNFLTSLRPGRPAWSTLASALRTLFLQGQSVQWRRLYGSSEFKYVRGLPGYPLSMTSYVVPYKIPGLLKTQPDGEKYDHQPRFSFLRPTSRNSTAGPVQKFSTALSQVGPFIKAHQVGGVPLCPASVYLEIVLQGMVSHEDTADGQGIFSAFERVSFEHPLVYSTEREVENDREIQTELHTKPAEAMRFSSTSGSDHILCSGEVRSVAAGSQSLTDILARRQARVERLKQSLVSELGQSAESFSSKTIYRVIFPRVVQYDDPFMTLHQLNLTSNGLEGKGLFRISPLISEHGQFVSSPVFVDTLLHAPGFMANTSVGADTACICVSLEQALIPHDFPSLHDQELQVYCSLVDIDHSYIADSYAIDVSGRVIGYIEGMCFKKVKLRSFKAHLSRQAAHGSEKAGPQRPEVPNQVHVSGIELGDNVLAGRAPVDGTVIAIIRDVCGIDYDPGPSSSLSEIGVDSLLGIELCQTLGKIFNKSISQSTLEDCTTVGNVIELLNGLQVPSKSQIPSLSATPGDFSAASSLRQEPRTPDIQVNKTLQPGSNVLLKSLFIEVCGLQPTKDDEDISLSSLGVDSLLSIELYHELRDKLGVSIEDGHESISELTFRQLEHICSSRSPSKSLNTANTTMTAVQIGGINSHPSSESLFNGTSACESPRTHTKLLQMINGEQPRDTMYLFHDGSGLCGMYSRLGSLDAVVYGVHTSNKDAGPDHDEQTMDSLARHYIYSANLASQDNLILGGWSFGGVLAYEVSRQLSRLGKRVKGVILIDSPAPVNHQALPREIARHVLSRGQPLQSDAAQMKLTTVEAAFTRHASMLQNYAPRGAGAGTEPGLVPCVIIRCTRTMDTERLCGVSYPWLSDADARDRSIAEWEALIGRCIPVLDVDCNHFSPFEPAHIGEVTRNMRLACEMLDQ